MDKLKTKILLISLLLIMLLSLQGAAASSDDGTLTSENIDLSIYDNEDYVGSDSLLAAANSEDMLGEGEGNFTELQKLIDAHYGRDLTLNKSYICNGEGQININGPITIHGNGNTLNGNIQARIFNVNASDVVIQDIVFTNGADTTGGAVYWTGENGKLTNCNFTNNTAYDGGAVYWKDNNGTLTNCNFTTNNANQNGGAIYWASDNGTLSNCNFTNNTADKNGGAAYWNGDNGNLTNCNFTNNNATQHGGAVYWYGEGNYGKNGKLTNCNFTNNHANTNGGAVNWKGYKGNLTNSNFTNNHANTNGGAVEWLGGYGNLANSNFANNTASNGGAVIWSVSGGNLTNSNFTNNHANSNGGAVYWNGMSGNLANSNFTNNTASNGGAVYWVGKLGNLANSNFTNNAAIYGGALSCSDENSDVSSSVFLNNKAISRNLTANNGKDSLTLTFRGGENYINAIYGLVNALVDVTYWDGKITTGTPHARSDYEAGQNITIEVYDYVKNLLDNVTIVTDLNGQVRYDFTHLFDGNYTYVAYHPDDAYYTYINATGNFTLNRNKTNITISVENATYGEYPVANITADVAGTYTLIIANKTYDPVVFTQQDVDNHKVKQVAVNELLDAKEGYVASLHFKGNEFYSAETQETLFNIEKISSTIVITKYISPITIGKESGVFFEIASNLGNHTVTLCINGSEISADDFKNNIGGFVIPKDNLTSKGTYNITVQCQGNSNYYASNIASCIITVNGINVTMNATGSTVHYGEDATITVTGLPGDAAGNVSVRVGDGIFFADIENGEATIEIPDLLAGKYEELIVKYSGDNKYNNASAEATVIVKPASSKIVIDPIDNVTYGEDIIVTYSVENETSLNITVTDSNGRTITDGVDASAKGKVVISGLDAGEYTIAISNAKEGNYLGSDDEAEFTVLKAGSTIGAANKTFDYPEDVVLVASGENSTGINESSVVVRDLNGVVKATVKVNGFKMTISGLGAGDYAVSYNNTVGNNWNGAGNATGISILKANSSVSAEDVNGSYGEAISIAVTSVNATEIYYEIIDNKNKVVANGTVKPNGTIKVSGLAAGDYTVNLTTVTDENHTSASGSSRLHVKHVVTIVIAPISGYAGEVVNFTAQFKYENGYPVNEGTADLAIKYDDRQVLGASMYSILGADDTYSTKVSDGKATFNVKLGSPGTYPYVVTYSGDDVDEVQAESTVTILKLNTTVSGDDISGKPSDEKSITINVLDQNNNTVNNGTVTLTLNGETYNATVDNGKAVLNIELPNPGTYDATVKYNGNDYYGSGESSINVNVEKVNTNAPSAEDISGKAGEKTNITISIDDENGDSVKNGTATLTIDGKTYTAEVRNGTATFKDVELPGKDTVADVYYQGNDYYNSNSTMFSIKIKQDNNNTEPENNTDENKTGKHVSSKAVDAKATGNPIAILVIVLFTLVITYRKKIKL